MASTRLYNIALRGQYRCSLLRCLSTKENLLVRRPTILARNFSPTALLSKKSERDQDRALGEDGERLKKPRKAIAPADVEVEKAKAAEAERMAEREVAQNAAKAALAVHMKIPGVAKTTTFTPGGEFDLDAKEIFDSAEVMMSGIRTITAEAKRPIAEEIKTIRAAGHRESFWMAILAFIDDHDLDQTKFTVFLDTMSKELEWDGPRLARLKNVILKDHSDPDRMNRTLVHGLFDRWNKVSQLNWLVNKIVVTHFLHICGKVQSPFDYKPWGRESRLERQIQRQLDNHQREVEKWILDY